MIKRVLRNWMLIASTMAMLCESRIAAVEPFFFIQLTDPQFGMFTDNTNFIQETANFEFAVASVNRLRPAFVVITGDLVNKAGDAAQIAEYRRIVKKIDPTIPVYDVAGNHDVENVPTAASIAAYTNLFGPQYYSFKHQDFVGIVLNSCLIHSPQNTAAQLAEQETWLKAELERARDGEARHVVVFQHHPWFLKSADEPDQYFNIPVDRRSRHLALFREFGVRYLFSGHYHRNAFARDGDLEAITTGPVGKPMGGDRSGLRVVIVREDKIEHRYHDFGQLPNRVDLGNAVIKSKDASSPGLK
jgi:serine/threonine-protein phosphatase CPPED1